MQNIFESGREVASSEIPCSGAAHTLLMRVYLQRAGYSLNCSSRQLTRPDDTTRKGYFEAVIKEWEALKAEGYHGFMQVVMSNCLRTILS